MTAPGRLSVKIEYHPYADGTRLCSVFTGACTTVERGVFTVHVKNGAPDVLVPSQ
jgi:hypothetical protein